jgi:hypothetical protein
MSTPGFYDLVAADSLISRADAADGHPLNLAFMDPESY